MDFKRIVTYIIILIVLTYFWIGLEYYCDGVIIEQSADTIICFISSFFISDYIYWRYIYKRGE